MISIFWVVNIFSCTYGWLLLFIYLVTYWLSSFNTVMSTHLLVGCSSCYFFRNGMTGTSFKNFWILNFLKEWVCQKKPNFASRKPRILESLPTTGCSDPSLRTFSTKIGIRFYQVRWVETWTEFLYLIDEFDT